ncbi:MAG: hypothetical protein JXA91_08045 [Candidatus Thermoplasmatota archaeon]|nr:hypothetical protein [Candidatus Thermoplasmatota archaeon]
MNREVAWRVFASEYNDSSHEIKNDAEKTPSYVITPLGAKINRLFIVGVLTDVERVSETGDMVRAHVSDPTGVFTLYSGQFQKDVTDSLLAIDVPAFVAVTGKSRTYKPEDSEDIFVSIRPEKVVEVTALHRNQWILETCQRTKERIDAIVEAKKMTQPNPMDLRKLGYNRNLAEGVVAALESYNSIDVSKYLSLIQESIQFILPSSEKLPDLQTNIEMEEEKPQIKSEEVVIANKIKNESEIKVDESEKKAFEEIENTVLKLIKDIEGEDGAPWDSIIEKCEKTGLDKDLVEEALTSLMDKGLIYEPILGTIKIT